MDSVSYFLQTFILGALLVTSLVTIRSFQRNGYIAWLIRYRGKRLLWVVLPVLIGWMLIRVHVRITTDGLLEHKGTVHLVTWPLLYLYNYSFPEDLSGKFVYSFERATVVSVAPTLDRYTVRIGFFGSRVLRHQDVEPLYSMDHYWIRYFIAVLLFAIAFLAYLIFFFKLKKRTGMKDDLY